jgi:hypothetical protein
MIEVTNPLAREQTMTKNEDRSKIVVIKELLERDEGFRALDGSVFCSGGAGSGDDGSAFGGEGRVPI